MHEKSQKLFCFYLQQATQQTLLIVSITLLDSNGWKVRVNGTKVSTVWKDLDGCTSRGISIYTPIQRPHGKSSKPKSFRILRHLLYIFYASLILGRVASFRESPKDL